MAKKQRGTRPLPSSCPDDDAEVLSDLEMQDPEDVAEARFRSKKKRVPTSAIEDSDRRTSRSALKSLEEQEADLVEAWGAKYAGRVRGRSSSGTEESDSDHSFGGSDQGCFDFDGSEASDRSDQDAGAGGRAARLYEEMRAIEDSAESAAPRLFASARAEAAAQGRALRVYFSRYSETMEMRARLQPILGLVNEREALRSGEFRERVLVPMAKWSEAVDDVAPISLRRLWHCHLEPSHADLMDEAQTVLLSIHNQSTTKAAAGGGRKKHLQIINQSAWEQVQMALRDRDRLFARTQRLRPVAAKAACPRLIFDDEDFFRVQVKDWVASVGHVAASPSNGNTVAVTRILQSGNANRTKKPTDWRRGKGRTLNTETVHTLLAGLVAPRANPAAWPGDRVGELCASLLGGAQ